LDARRERVSQSRCIGSAAQGALIRAAASTQTLDGSVVPEMKESKFYRLSLVLPLVVPAIVAPLLFVDFPFPEWLVWAVLYTTYSGAIGGFPYLALVGLLFWWARGRSDTQFRRTLSLLPIFMLPVFAVFLVLALLGEAWLRPESALPPGEILRMLLTMVPFILGFGYFYVLLVFGMAFLLKRRGKLVRLRAI